MGLPPKYKRMALVLGGIISVAGGSAVILNVFQESLVFYYTPGELQKKSPQKGSFIRLGGYVLPGTLKKRPPNHYQFQLSDYTQSILVQYEGAIPDLFREGQGTIVEGTFESFKTFKAQKLFTKHDENYRPPKR